MAAEKEPTYWLSSLEWFICRSSSALGSRSAHASFVAILERGGHSSSGTFEDPYHAGMIGETARFRDEGAVAMYRRIWPRWRWLSPQHQHVLVVHYGHTVAPAELESDAAATDFGGRRPIPASVDAAFRMEKRNTWDHSVSVGAVALELAKNGKETARILKACGELARQPQGWRQTAAGRQHLACLEAPMRRAQKAVGAAHAAYVATENSEAVLWVM